MRRQGGGADGEAYAQVRHPMGAMAAQRVRELERDGAEQTKKDRGPTGRRCVSKEGVYEQ